MCVFLLYSQADFKTARFGDLVEDAQAKYIKKYPDTCPHQFGDMV